MWAPPEASAEANPWAALAPPPPKPPRDWAALGRKAAPIAGAAGVLVVVVAVGMALFSGDGDGSVGGPLDEALPCKETLVRGRDLICLAPSSILNELTPADREARLARARELGSVAGVNRVVFEDRGRVYRTLVLNAPGLPSTTKSATVSSSPQASSPQASSSQASSSQASSPPVVGPVDSAPN
jgi:hypothetical protein